MKFKASHDTVLTLDSDPEQDMQIEEGSPCEVGVLPYRPRLSRSVLSPPSSSMSSLCSEPGVPTWHCRDQTARCSSETRLSISKSPPMSDCMHM